MPRPYGLTFAKNQKSCSNPTWFTPIAFAGMEELRAVPLASWPLAFAPQHWTVPAPVATHACCSPDAMAAAPLARPDTADGVEEFALLPLPSCPLAFAPQHSVAPEASTAQLLSSPLEIARTPVSGDFPSELNTSTGVAEEAVTVPLPSWPPAFAPQQKTFPPDVSAQASSKPAEIVTTPPSGVLPDASKTTVGVVELGNVALPSCPEAPLPQHSVPPVVVTAQVKSDPAAMVETPVLSPETGTGKLETISVPLPSWPLLLSPQQRAAPALVTAHA
jgi:hypothetical protein